MTESIKYKNIRMYLSLIDIVVQVHKTEKVKKRWSKVHDILVLRFKSKNQCMWSFNKQQLENKWTNKLNFLSVLWYKVKNKPHVTQKYSMN